MPRWNPAVQTVPGYAWWRYAARPARHCAVGGQRTDVGGFGEDDAGTFDHLTASHGDGVQALALAREQAEAEFIFQLLELLADAGLGGMDTFGGDG